MMMMICFSASIIITQRCLDPSWGAGGLALERNVRLPPPPSSPSKSSCTVAAPAPQIATTCAFAALRISSARSTGSVRCTDRLTEASTCFWVTHQNRAWRIERTPPKRTSCTRAGGNDSSSHEGCRCRSTKDVDCINGHTNRSSISEMQTEVSASKNVHPQHCTSSVETTTATDPSVSARMCKNTPLMFALDPTVVELPPPVLPPHSSATHPEQPPAEPPVWPCACEWSWKRQRPQRFTAKPRQDTTKASSECVMMGGSNILSTELTKSSKDVKMSKMLFTNPPSTSTRPKP
mmetsp:Transcript_27355/g.76042  ORF Transcript_27355/g.76042 Transcript_27355/m.76042 type:complete len:292 (+) Transcript_27355:3-878(+)